MTTKKQKKDLAKSGDFLLYQTEDGSTRIQVRMQGETVWLTQKQMAELFQTTPQNVTLHLKAIFSEGELNEGATCKDYLHVRQEGQGDIYATSRMYFFPLWQRGIEGDLLYA